MISFDKTTFLHIVYPPLTGGNHVLNLLSTYSKFNNLENHIENLLKLYNSKINLIPNETIYETNYKFNTKPDLISKGFHVHYDQTNQSLRYYKNLEHYTKANLLQAHADEYKASLSDITIKNNLFKHLRFTTGIIITVPRKETSRLYKRVSFFNANNSYISNLSMTDYKLPFKILGYEIFNYTNAILLDSDIFGELEGSEYFQNLIYDNFNVKLPVQIHELHRLWIKMVDQSLTHK